MFQLFEAYDSPDGDLSTSEARHSFANALYGAGNDGSEEADEALYQDFEALEVEPTYEVGGHDLLPDDSEYLTVGDDEDIADLREAERMQADSPSLPEAESTSRPSDTCDTSKVLTTVRVPVSAVPLRISRHSL